MSSIPRCAVVLLAAAAVLAGLVTAPAATASPAAPAAPAAPTVAGGASQPVYSYARAVREHVTVVSPVDSDGDGVADRIAVDIVRPGEASAGRVPVIMEASPYYACCGRGNESQLKGYAADGTVDAMPLYYDNYFVPRGYAFVAADLAGTNESTGCPDVGGPSEVLGAKAVIDWLNGRATAYDAQGRQVTAAWTTGRVGMIGKSWDATIANGVAATGVQGLATIVPIAGISSWYGYERFSGVLRSTGYPTYLASVVSGRPAAVCRTKIAADQAAADDSTGDLNAYWDARNYRTSAANVHASVFVVHGLNDLNVTTDQFGTWWAALGAAGVTRKIWLSQEGHVDPFDYRRSVWVTTLHRWFDSQLLGVANGITTEPQASIERASGQWTASPSWPAPGATGQVLTLGTGDGTTGTLDATGAGTRTFTDRPGLTEAKATAAPQAAVAGRAVFLTQALTAPVRLSGQATATLRVQVDRPTTELTVKLVDYGTQTRIDYLSPGSGISTGTTRSCWGSSTATDSACYLDTAEVTTTSAVDVLSRGWQDAAHAGNLRRTKPLQPGAWYTITVPLAPHDDLVAAGHVLGLVLTQSDREYTTPATTGATLTVDLAHSTVSLPVVGRGVPTSAVPPATAAAVPGVDAASPAATTPVDRTRPTFG